MNGRSIIISLVLVIFFATACNRKSASTGTSDKDHPTTGQAYTDKDHPTTEKPSTPEPPAQEKAPTAQPPLSPPAAAKVATPRPAEPPPEPPAPQPLVIPSGTVVTVRLQQPLDSKSSQPGQRFEGALAQPIVVDGTTVAPTGSSVSGVVTEAHAAGHFKGGASLNLTLDRLNIHGTPYHIQTAGLAQSSKGKGKRTATIVGGGAGAGALIGGLAGGGKGAAIGALVGGGAGTAGAGMTGNNDITLPAESALSFRMSAPLTLKPASPAADAVE